MSDEVVLLSPIVPSADGPGLSMRADQLVRALAASHRVHVRVIPIEERSPALPRTSYEGPCASYEVLWHPPSLFHRLRHRRDSERSRVSQPVVDTLVQSIAGIEPSAIIAFRHYLAPLGFILRARRPSARLIVDLDELESHTRERLAELHERRHEHRAARAVRRQATIFREREKVELASANQLWTCSSKEAEWIESATGLSALIVPNVVDRVSTDTRSPDGGPETETGRTLLFVGGLGQLQNLDAVEWFASAILPRLRERQETTFRVVGTVPPSARRSLRRIPGLELAGRVESLEEEYARAAVAVVPMRAGGGTRIKLLEALAHGRPVVSTSIGAEGLDLAHGRELLTADDAASFAQACEELLQDRVRAEAIGRSGQERVRDAYSPEKLASIIERSLQSEPSRSASEA